MSLEMIMSRKQTQKKIVSKIPGRVEARIVELSLQNPEFGARRLSPLLKKKKISVSSSQIYTILKRHDLQTRAKRTAKLAEQSRKKPAPAAKKKPPRITDEVAEHIVQLSLQNPDYGARRLVPLLEKDGIQVNASAVYRVLKRNGLQNRDKRLARSEGQQAVEALPAESEQLRSQIVEKTSPPHVLAAPKTLEKTKSRGPWILTLFNILLLLLLVFLGLYAWQNIRRARLEPEIIAAIPPAPAIAAANTNPNAGCQNQFHYPGSTGG